MSHLKLPVGIDDFAKVREDNYTYIDKSLFIKDVIDDSSETVLITRPRRFGKTINLSMLNYYFNIYNTEKNAELFNDLNVMKSGDTYLKHQGRYPVISLTFKGIKSASYEELQDEFRALISDLYDQHAYLLESDALTEYHREAFVEIIRGNISLPTLHRSLLKLSQYLHAHYNERVIILIDEYDTPIHSSYLHGFHKQAVETVKNIMGHALKGNKYLEKSVVTGILRVAKANMFSDLNNISIYTMLHKQYADCFGFTIDEVRSLLEKAKGNGQKLELATQWYNGYRIADITLYNPWSILNFVKNDFEPQAYWVGTGGDVIVRELLLKSDLDTKRYFEKLLQGEKIHKTIDEYVVFENLETDREVIWGLLLFGGYLRVDSVEYIGTVANCTLSIPNNEVASAHSRIVGTYFNVLSGKSYETFINSLLTGDAKQFQLSIQNYLNESTSYFDLNKHTPEQVYHLFVLGLIIGLRDRYLIQSNRESGSGRYDVMLIPKQLSENDTNKKVYANHALPAMVLEFKTAEVEDADGMRVATQAAFAQIDKQNYVQQLQAHGAKDIRKVAMAFAGKSVYVEMQG